MARARLPDRRDAEAIAFEHDGRRWTATFGRFPDGRLAEVFLDAPKESPLAEAARESALLASLALQHGCPLLTLRHALDGRDAGPLAAALTLINDGERHGERS
jgi:ribonucleoside-diphosphate reductase alpha chain